MLARTEVDELALLARLRLTDEEAEALRGDLGAILEHFGALAAVDTAGVEPMTHAGPAASPLRPDEVQPSLPVDDALRATPVRHGDLIAVPAILPGSEPP